MSREATPLYLVYGADALPGLLYRIVERCPPVVDDFRSYEALGKHYDRRDFFKGTGVSMHTTRERSVAVARHRQTGGAIAILDLRGARVAWASTGGREHVTIWAPAEQLLERVVQCWGYE
jgi:hypothetical protein